MARNQSANDGPADSTAESPPGDPAAVMQADSIEQLRRQADEAQKRAVRAIADLDNYQKRVRREMEDERRYAELPLLRDLLPVLDNVGRAIAAAEGSADATLLEGFQLVAKQLETILKQHHCTKIDALHRPFDPAWHAAALQQPSAEHPPGTIIAVLQDGYQLHDRVIRPAHVIVAAP